MTSPGNSSRLRTRLRSAANAICARSSKLSKSSNHLLHRSNSNKNSNQSSSRHHSLSRTNSIHRSNSMHNNKHLNNNVNKSLDKNSNNQNSKSKVGSQQQQQQQGYDLFLAGKFTR